MVHLEEVDLSENEVIFFSPSFSKLPLLTTLNLSKNCKSTESGHSGWVRNRQPEHMSDG